ncbi:MAG: Gfo/Idh/MocA family oxidoreductase [Actinomycetota bacterium]
MTPSQQAEYAARPIRWGIAGPGGIAAKFAADFPHLDGDAEIVAVGSRRRATADEFGDRFGIERRHASYADLAADGGVDAVYVATPHPMHYDTAMLAIEAGKHVLIEKPFTINAGEAGRLVAAARNAGVLLMEAMWTRFLPHMDDVRQILARGELGDIRTVTADHGQWFAEDAEFRLFAPDLGGGALLDLGVYPISFASMVLGKPDRITAVSDPAFTGVDAQTSMIFQYDAGRHAVLTTTLQAASANVGTIVGTEARIEIERTFYAPTSFSVISRAGEVSRHEHPRIGNGLRYQAAEVARCLRAGLLESPLLPLDETVEIMETMDEVRRQIGLVYPQEK